MTRMDAIMKREQITTVEGTDEDAGVGVASMWMGRGDNETVVSQRGKTQRALFPVWVRGNETVSEQRG